MGEIQAVIQADEKMKLHDEKLATYLIFCTCPEKGIVALTRQSEETIQSLSFIYLKIPIGFPLFNITQFYITRHHVYICTYNMYIHSRQRFYYYHHHRSIRNIRFVRLILQHQLLIIHYYGGLYRHVVARQLPFSSKKGSSDYYLHLLLAEFILL